MLRPAASAKVDFYIMKGTHHYISCVESEKIDIPTEVLCNPLWAFTCVNPNLIAQL